MQIVEQMATDVVERLRVIRGLCADIASRLEDEASVQTIPRNYEYDGRRTALAEIADDIQQTISDIEKLTEPNTISERVKALFHSIETRKQHNEEEQERNKDYQHNFRLYGMYYTPRGAIAGCEKVLEWLNESLKPTRNKSTP